MTSEQVFQLTSGGLKNVRIDPLDHGFEFVFNGFSYFCPVWQAEFLSRKIALLRRSDVCFDKYVVSTTGPPTLFEQFLLLGIGETIPLHPADMRFMRMLAEEMDNEQLCDTIKGLGIDVDNISVDTVIRYIESFGGAIGIDFPSERDIEYVAEHWPEIPEELLYRLSLDTLCSILSHQHLVLESEDALYRFISRLIQGIDVSFVRLLEFLCFDRLSKPTIERFVRESGDYIFGHMNSAVWSSICQRLMITPEKEATSYAPAHVHAPGRDGSNRYMTGVQDIVYDEAHQTKGIIDCLRKVDYDSVEVTGLHPEVDCDPNSVLDFENERFFKSEPVNGAWLCIDFKRRSVRLTHYVLKAAQRPVGDGHPKSWVIEVSTDGNRWQEIARVDNDRQLNMSGETVGFPVTRSEFGRMIRMRQTDKNHRRQNSLLLGAIEFFGTIRE